MILFLTAKKIIFSTSVYFVNYFHENRQNFNVKQVYVKTLNNIC